MSGAGGTAALDATSTAAHEAPGAQRAAGSVIVEDGEVAGDDQITRGLFFRQLDRQVRAAVDDALRPIGRSSADCPYLERYLAHYRTQPLDHLVRAVRLYAQPARDDPQSWASAIAERAGTAAVAWTEGRRDPFLRRITPSGEADLAISSERAGTDPMAARAQLGRGQPIDGDTRARAERSFGVDLSRVRVHTDEAAARIASATGSRAFAVGDDIGFARGQHRPGTLAGDAVLAHEVAHTVQQRGSTVGTPAETLERDADQAAVSALTGERRSVRPGRGLQLQRCGSEGSGYDPARHDEYHEAPPTPAEMIARHTTGPDLDEEGLAETLAVMLYSTPADHSDYIRRLFDLLEGHNRDDVAAAMLARLPDAELSQIAQTETGRRLLEELEPHLTEGWTFPGSDIHAATRAVRAAAARRSSAAAAVSELDAMRSAVESAVPAEETPSTGPAGTRERSALVRTVLNRMAERWGEDRAVMSAVGRARRGLATASAGSGDAAGRLPFAQETLELMAPTLKAIDGQMQLVRRAHAGSERATIDLLVFVREQVVGAIGAVFDADGPQRLARARTAVERLSFSVTRVELAIMENRPTLFGSVRPKLLELQGFARWTVGELESIRSTVPSTPAEEQALADRIELIANASRLLAHWDVLIQVAEAIESGFSFTEWFYGHDVDIDSIHARLARISGLAEGGDGRAFKQAIDAFVADEEIAGFYEDIPSILKTSGIAVAIAITVVAALVTYGIGSAVAAPGGAAAGAGAGAGTATQISVPTLVALTALDSIVFTSVHQTLATAAGLEGSGNFFEELAWNFALFGLLRWAGGGLTTAMKARGYSRLRISVTSLAGAASILEVYGVFRFWLAERRLPTWDEFGLMTAEMVAVLAILVAAHRVLEPHTPLARFNREFGAEFRAIESDRATLQRDVNQAMRDNSFAGLEAEFRSRGQALEQRTAAWAERAGAWSRLPAVRSQLRGMRDVQDVAQAVLAESMGMGREVSLQRAGTPTDFTFASGRQTEVARALREQGAEVRITRSEGEPTVVEGRFADETTLQFAEREATAREVSRQRATAERDPASEEAAQLQPDLTPPPAAEVETRFAHALDAEGRFVNAEVEADYQAYLGRGSSSPRAVWMNRTGGGPLARLRAWLGPEFRPSRSTRHVDRPRLGQVDEPFPVRPFHDPLRSELRVREQAILDLAETDAMQAGVEYQEVVASDLRASDVQEWSQRPHRRNDIGGGAGSAAATRGIEVTIEGRSGPMSSSKLDQLWLDLEQTGGITLVVPRLSEAARSQLGRMIRQFELRHPDAPRPHVGVRETLPPSE